MLNDNQTRYLAAMAVFRQMRNNGLITGKEYADIDTTIKCQG